MRGPAIVILAVDNVERAVAFYKAAFGGIETVVSPSYVELDIGGTVRLGLYERTAFGQNIGRIAAGLPPGEVTRTELYFRVDELDEATRKLEAAGARLLSAAQRRPWGETAAYYADPDGNVLAVAVAA